MKRDLPPGTLALATAHSINEKLGRAGTTYVEQRSCPTDCVFFDGGGCYAEDGPVGKFITAPLNRAALLESTGITESTGVTDSLDSLDSLDVRIAKAEADAIDALPDHEIKGLPLRLHTVGDCATDEAARIVAAAAERYRARGGGPVWTYTHAWRIVCREAWGQSVSVLASCETGEDVFLAHSRGYATAMVVEEFITDKLYKIGGASDVPGVSRRTATNRQRGPCPSGVTEPGADSVSDIDNRTCDGDASGTTPTITAPGSVLLEKNDGGLIKEPAVSLLPCPAQTRDRSCSSCGLCFDDDRLRETDMTIGFAIHGTQFLRRKARLALNDPTNPDRKLTSRVLIPRFVEAWRAEHGTEPTQAQIARGLGMNPSSVYEMMRSLRTGQPTKKKPHRRKAKEVVK